MIIEIRVKNCFAFDKQVIFSMKADMRNKKFASDIYTEDKYHILKTVGRYGPYNAGKICLVTVEQYCEGNYSDLSPFQSWYVDPLSYVFGFRGLIYT